MSLLDHNEFNWTKYQRAMTKKGVLASFQTNLEYILAKDHFTATMQDYYKALALATRDRIVERWISTQQEYHNRNLKRVYYLSMEFLIGRLLGTNIYNLGIELPVDEAMREVGLDLESLREQELDAGLGNGGLGRLAACYLDSMATLGIPAHGYGIRYEYGIFNQQIRDGYQVELPDEWLKTGYPWEFCRPEYSVPIRFYGRTVRRKDSSGREYVQWQDTDDVLAVPYDTPVIGYKNNIVNTLRLWSAKSTEEFDLSYFNDGDYEQAVYNKLSSENISKILYPNDQVSQGKELRLKQEYFFVAASIADILRRFKVENSDFRKLPEKAQIQLNDTHPSLSVVELMRILVDKHDLKWDTAWDITRNVFNYTNHTLLPEALETWSVSRFGKLLPRHLEIVYEINHRYMNEIRSFCGGDTAKERWMSVVDEEGEKQVRMAHLSIIGSKKVNGVSALHSELLKTRIFKDFNELYPEKFVNVTNGITQRRWLLKSNPLLSELITETIGDKWVTDLEKLKKLEDHVDDEAFLKRWMEIKQTNKDYLAGYVASQMGVSVDPHSMFDVQIKRIHEYKRQMMFALYIIAEYLKVRNDPNQLDHPRTFMIGGKAAPGYRTAKLIIKFINNIAAVINKDKSIRKKLRVVFLENYRVSLAEKVFPASELSEQISTAGMEASGTGNMKFMLNGALTIGTLDGANVEIVEQAGDDNAFIFGLKANEVQNLRQKGYDPRERVDGSPLLKEIHSLISKDFFNPKEPGLFNELIQTVFYKDYFLVCADFDAYYEAQQKVSRAYSDQREWTRKSIFNVANAGLFSSDRSIRDYARNIWDVPSA